MINDMLNGIIMIIHLIVSLIKWKILLYKMSYFPEPYTRGKNKIKVESDFSNYARRSDLKNVAGVDASKFAKKIDLASLN